MAWYNLLERIAPALGAKKDGMSVHRVLLCGRPGTGKSSWPSYNLSGPVTRVNLTRDSGPEELLGSYLLQSGSTVFQDGPAITAFRSGGVLVIDEIEKASPSIHSTLLAVLDDCSIASVCLPTGETVTPADGFICIATSNAPPTSLPDPLLDRFEITLADCNLPTPPSLERVSDVRVRKAVSAFYQADQKTLQPWSASLSLRKGLAISAIMAMGEEEDIALQLTCGHGARELASVFAAYGGDA